MSGSVIPPLLAASEALICALSYATAANEINQI